MSNNDKSLYGKTILTGKRYTENCIQLFFACPDGEYNYEVDIEMIDSTGVIDSINAVVREKFRYMIYSKTDEPVVTIKVMLDKEIVYQRRVIVPGYLRLKKKIDKTPEKDTSVQQLVNNDDNLLSEFNGQSDYVNLDKSIDLYDIANDAKNMIGGKSI